MNTSRNQPQADANPEPLPVDDPVLLTNICLQVIKNEIGEAKRMAVEIDKEMKLIRELIYAEDPSKPKKSDEKPSGNARESATMSVEKSQFIAKWLNSGKFHSSEPFYRPLSVIPEERQSEDRHSPCDQQQEDLHEFIKKLLVDQLSKYTTEQMIRRDIRNISTVKYPPGSISYLISAYVKENINFDWVSRSEEDLKYLNKRKMFYEKTNKPEDATRAHCFAVLIENLDVVILQDANVLRMQEFKPNYAILELQWLRTVFPNLHVS